MEISKRFKGGEKRPVGGGGQAAHFLGFSGRTHFTHIFSQFLVDCAENNVFSAGTPGPLRTDRTGRGREPGGTGVNGGTGQQQSRNRNFCLSRQTTVRGTRPPGVGETT